ncbi:nuclear transport factor 2 family protein [Streptomyces sp. NPDC093085]|uniref:nuclear transport factor 2 family protein n=1 Tax=Streptomyces sp. NPDC093085 TaxID=3155068 RepID=UPI003438E3B5
MTGPERSWGEDDRQEVTALYARYTYAYDEGRPEELAALFTEDGAFEAAGADPVRGTDALARMVRAAALRPYGTRHLVSGVLVSGAGDAASGTAYVVALRIGPGAVTPLALGRYDDTFARTARGWRIRRRRFAPFLPPAP